MKAIHYDLDRIKSLIAAGCTRLMIANQLGISESMVNKIMYKHDLKSHGFRDQKKPIDQDQVIDLRTREFSTAAIAKRLHTSALRIKTMIQDLDLPPVKKGRPGNRKRNQIPVTAEDIYLVTKLWTAGFTQEAIGKVYDTTMRVVHSYCRKHKIKRTGTK